MGDFLTLSNICDLEKVKFDSKYKYNAVFCYGTNNKADLISALVFFRDRVRIHLKKQQN